MCYGATGSCPGSGSNFGPAAVDRCRDLVGDAQFAGQAELLQQAPNLIPTVNRWKAESRQLSMG